MPHDDTADKRSGGRDKHKHHHHHHHTSQSGDGAPTSEAAQSEESRGLLSESGKNEGRAKTAMESLEERIRAKQRAASKQSASPAPAKHEPAGSFEALLERKQRAAAASASTNPPRAAAASEQVAAYERRIDAKRSANNNILEASNMRTARDVEMVEQGASNMKDDQGYDDDGKVDDELQATTKSDKDGDELLRESEDMFHEQGRSTIPESRESDRYYPNVRTDSRIMQEIAQEGIQVDESGGIQAFVAEAVVDEAAVIGVIRSDEEVEREERREYLSFFMKAVACIVFLIVVIGVPVTLKLTNVIGEVVTVTPSPTDVPSMMPSSTPSAMPSSAAFTDVVEKLMPISGDKLLDVGSPQHKAARWVADEDPMQLDMDDPSFQQRYVMAVFYYSLDGDNWNSKDGWLSGQSECNWEYVTGPGCVDGCINGKVCAFKMGKWKYDIFVKLVRLEFC